MKGISRVFITLILCCFCALLLASPSSAISTRVHAFYYPWYGNPTVNGYWIHWDENGHNPSADDLAAPFYPQLGGFSSKDSNVIHQHMKWLVGAGVGVIVVSWWGRGTYEDNRSTQILDTANLYGIKVCFHIEPYGGRTAARYSVRTTAVERPPGKEWTITIRHRATWAGPIAHRAWISSRVRKEGTTSAGSPRGNGSATRMFK